MCKRKASSYFPSEHYKSCDLRGIPHVFVYKVEIQLLWAFWWNRLPGVLQHNYINIKVIKPCPNPKLWKDFMIYTNKVY